MRILEQHEPTEFPGFIHTVYDFGNGYGALHVDGAGETPVVDEHDDVVMVPFAKNELHPLVLPRFGTRAINYAIHPQIDVTAGTLQAELERLALITNGA